MEIERINENTVKFYISYVDIEGRGFRREEIWYNRDRGEQLFWQMMEEVNFKEDFTVEGPLWIQVQALEKGLEVVVTRAQASKHSMENLLDGESDTTLDITVGDKLDRALSERFGKPAVTENNDDDGDSLWMIAGFESFEDAIQLSHYFDQSYEEQLVSAFYHYEDKYYIYLELSASLFEEQDDILSQVFEYSEESELTHHMLEEYGKIIFKENVFEQIRTYFDA